MDTPANNQNTLLNVFIDIARSSDVERTVVECGEESWTYGDLDCISTALALEMYQKYGPKPVVAIVSENHPYVLATLLATWKLGGIVAPLDYNVPRDIMERMLLNIGPTFVLVPSTEVNVQNIVKDIAYLCSPFDAMDSTVTGLMQRYLDQSPELAALEFPAPSPGDIALYLHTSSASSVVNVKCVPITHRSILSGATARLAWWKRTWPEQDFQHLKVLGWSPWSHIIGLSHDLGAATLLTRGTYIFAMIPSAYGTTPGDANRTSRYLDVCGQLLETAMSKKPTAFAGVPWVMEGFMRTFKQETDLGRKERIYDAIKTLKVFGSGGAATNAECLEWASQLDIPIVLDIGMTELGGPLFHSTVGRGEGWYAKDSLLPDATLSLIGEEGSPGTTEGELVIRSSYITKGYLQYDNSSFTIEDDGTVSFRTGDIYGYVGDQRIAWKGRKEDYIQMSSGESLDPRVVEAILDACPAIARSCVVGNNFLKTSSQVVCAIIEPAQGHSSSPEITRAVAAANRGLAPPLRVSWARVLVLEKGQQVPITKKGAIFRKKLEQLFGEQLNALLSRSQEGIASQTETKPSVCSNLAQGRTKDQISSIVSSIVTDALRISRDTLDGNTQATFAELGMDSSMSTKIVNQLNRQLEMRLPLNTCHTYIDLVSLTNAVLSNLGIEDASDAKVRPTARVAPPAREKEDIVIVGQAVRLPGDIDTPQSFWQALIDQRDDVITPVPESRWDHASFYRAPDSKDPPGPCDITLEKAGWVDLAHFDHGFFGVSSVEAYHMAPTIRLALEIAFEALESANIPTSKIKGSQMGVFVATGMDEGYIKLLFADKGWGAYTRFYATGVATSTACGRISYLLDVHGPSITIDTACSSGIIALDSAVQYLQSGEGESAIVCGSNTHPWPGIFGFLSGQKMTSPSSHCATFTNLADGYVPSEGAAGLILKTKSAALRDGDRILGVIRATDVKHDGRSQGLVAPNVKAQIAMQIALLEKAQLSPSQIDFIEAHGTGTTLGDLIEIQGINEVFKSSHSPEQPLVVGASKSCVGHTEIIAGLIGVLKVLGTFADGTVPGLVQLTKDNMNPSLDCSVVPLHIPIETAAVKQNTDLPLRALVLSNGFAGSIAGAILEAPSEDMKPQPTARIPENMPMLFVVSGKSEAALTQYLNNYLDFCLEAPASSFHSVCYTTCVGREHYRYRFACIANNMQDLIARIEDRIQNPPATNGGNARRILFGFPGQGSQYQGMARSLATQYSGFRNVVTEVANKASALTGYPILPYLVEESAPGHMSIDQSEVAQVCIFVFQYSMATWLETLGVQAHAVMGHSLGEIAASVIAGASSFDHGLQFVVIRAKLLRADPAHPGGMAAVAAPEERVNHYISSLGLRGRVAIAVHNGPDSIVVSGELKGVEKLMAAAKRDGLRSVKLVVDQGFHSPSIAPALPALKAWLDEHEASMKPLEKPFFSTVRAREIPKHQDLNSQYWVDHAQNSVKFLQTARVAHKSSSIDVVIDVGPQPTVWSNMQSSEFAGKSRLAFTGKRGKDQILAMLTALSALFEKGFTIDFSALFSQMPYRFTMTDIPTYPFQRILNYPTYIASRNNLLGVGQSQARATSTCPRFVVDQALCDFLDLHRIEGRRVLPGAAMVDFFARAAPKRSVKTVKFHVPLVLETPDTQARVEVEKSSFKLVQEGCDTTKFCSGTFSGEAPVHVPKRIVREPEVVPLQIMSKSQVYECFKNVAFGEPFRTVQQVKFWADHAVGDIIVDKTSSAAHDRIRKLDACLHMFAAVSSKAAPPVDDTNGAFLPTSLEDFTLHTDDIPYNFTCRYYLPLEVGRGARVLSGSFEVFSESGELLVSCKKYTVAWVPRGGVHKEQEACAVDLKDVWLRNGWSVQSPAQQEESSCHKYDELLYVGNGPSSRVLKALSTSARDALSLEVAGLPQDAEGYKNDNVKCLATGQIDAIVTNMRGQDVLVVFDVSKANNNPDSSEFTALYIQLLSLLRFMADCKIHISTLLAITSWSAPVDLYTEGLDLFSDSKATSTTLVGAILHGMLRVFRRETGMDFAAWCLDLPSLDSVDQSKLNEIISAEMQAHRNVSGRDTFICYREDSSKKSLSRLVPRLQPIEKVPARSPSGTTVVVGMGHIGTEIASALVEAGCSTVVFLGRRPESHEDIRAALARIPEKARGHCMYRQGDAADMQSLKNALADINYLYGGIKNVIHTAAVVKTANIKNFDASAYEDVLRPKVLGSWNLHIACQELNLSLDSFVLCSSANVLVGNSGQSACISANAFMDSLATYRHNCGLSGSSLQLGAPESMDMGDGLAFHCHSEEVASILKAMMVPIPLQIVARVDLKNLASTPTSSEDPFFASLLPPSKKTAASTDKARVSTEDAKKIALSILRAAMELQPNETLDTNEPLGACGADSIAFAQFKGHLLKELQVDVPDKFLSDEYTIGDMISNILETYSATA
ncbi:unnamed protein product [Cyclocybe aegerita]|uniref:Polyketide synthase n=1 Tax=Cyclocybe aegerita TaxID=1973307 RepID=A0A8S0VVV4_CYCAE|nr:unnamed protein product [Cyclocybe aegerita]